MVHGRVLGRMLRYEAGVFEHDGGNARPANPHRAAGGRTTAGRVVISPFGRGKSRAGNLRAGMAAAWTDLPEGLSGLRGSTALGERFYRADALVNGSRTRIGLELQWETGRSSLKSEYIRLADERRGQSVEDGDLTPLIAAGWYVSGTRTLVQERRWPGTLELAGRIERIAFNSASLVAMPSASPRADVVLGGRDTALTLGLNWSPIRWIRVQANVIRETVAAADGGAARPGPLWSRALRFQVAL
jgi:hypothetical protein